jgi:PBP1b-binding outer membrane lipoprotein LpoB
MKKIIFAIAALLILSGCTQYSLKDMTDEELGAMLARTAETELQSVQSLSDISVASEYGISPKDIEYGAVYRSNENNTADELVLVKAVNRDGLENIETALKARANTVVKARKYDKAESQKAEGRILKTRGLYTMLVISDKADEVEKAFDNALK